jgi:hypothetical protein
MNGMSIPDVVSMGISQNDNVIEVVQVQRQQSPPSSPIFSRNSSISNNQIILATHHARTTAEAAATSENDQIYNIVSSHSSLGSVIYSGGGVFSPLSSSSPLPENKTQIVSLSPHRVVRHHQTVTTRPYYIPPLHLCTPPNTAKLNNKETVHTTE